MHTSRPHHCEHHSHAHSTASMTTMHIPFDHHSHAAAALVRLELTEPVCQGEVWLLRCSLLIPCPLSTDWAALAVAEGAADKHSILTDPCLCFAGDSGFADSNSLEITGEGCAGVTLGWWDGGQLLCSGGFLLHVLYSVCFPDRAVCRLLGSWYPGTQREDGTSIPVTM